MITITFQGPAALSFVGTLTIGQWANFTLAADPAPAGPPFIHVEHFSTTVLDVSSTTRTEVSFQAEEDAGAAYLQLRVDNRAGSILTVLSPGADTFLVQPNQSAEIIYNRAITTRKDS